MASCLLLLWLLGSGPVWESPRTNPNTVTVLTEFEDDYSALSYEAMRAEIATILEPVGITSECRLYRTGQPVGVMSNLVVVRLSGGCLPDRHPEHPSQPTPLGWAHVTDGEVTPFVEIDCGHVRSMTAPVLRRASLKDRAKVFGRALGRIVAHEVFHVLCRTTGHSHEGIAKSRFSAEDLLGNSLQFDGESAAKLKSFSDSRRLKRQKPTGP